MINGFNIQQRMSQPMLPGGGPHTPQAGTPPVAAPMSGGVTPNPASFMPTPLPPAPGGAHNPTFAPPTGSFMPTPLPPAPAMQPRQFDNNMMGSLLDIFNRPMPQFDQAPLPEFTTPPPPQFTPYQAPTFLQPNFSVNQGRTAPPAPMNMKGMFGFR